MAVAITRRDMSARELLLGMLRDEGVSLCAKCSGQHPARPVTGDLGQWIFNSFRLTQGR